MDHSEAQQSQAVERYILFEMKPDEREAFEEHFFDCRECAQDVRESARLVAAGRTVARQGAAVVPFRRSWTAWMPAAAAAVLVIIAAGLYVPRGSGPSLEKTQLQSISAGMSRAGAESIVLRAGVPALLSIEVAPDAQSARYEIVVRDSSSKRAVTSYTATAEEAREPVNLLLRSLPAGSYEVAIFGVRADGSRTEVAVHSLQVQ